MSKRAGKLKAHSKKHVAKNNKAPVSKSQPFRAPTNAHSHSSSNPDRQIRGKEGGQNARSRSTIRLLKLYKSKPKKDEERKKQALQPARIQPDRRWFGNTRVISQTKLEKFREALETTKKDPMSIMISRTKLPVSLFDHSSENPSIVQNNLVGVEPFKDLLKKGVQAKRPRLNASGLQELVERTEKRHKDYDAAHDSKRLENVEERETMPRNEVDEAVFHKGTSGRIWSELYKVVDSSDVIIEVVDARDPLGTRCRHLEEHLRKERSHKYLILLVNKCDLIPSWVARKWVNLLSKEYPTVAYRASQTKPFGKKSLISLLRQYAYLLTNRKHVSVGFVGYPNVGKSSVINSLKGKEVCKTAPIPGETKVWQYISLTSKVYLIDCPGIVAVTEGNNDTEKIIKGIVRAEKIEQPEQYMDEILEKISKESIRKTYKLSRTYEWATSEELLGHIAVKRGKLLKGGEPDISSVARSFIFDLQRGKLPYFVTAWSSIREEKQETEVDPVEEKDEQETNSSQELEDCDAEEELSDNEQEDASADFGDADNAEG